MLPKSAMGAVAIWTPCLGNSAIGPLFGTPETISCNADMTQRRVTNAQGQDLLSAGTLYCNADEAVNALDRMEYQGRGFVVISTDLLMLGKRQHHIEVVLGSVAQ